MTRIVTCRVDELKSSATTVDKGSDAETANQVVARAGLTLPGVSTFSLCPGDIMSIRHFALLSTAVRLWTAQPAIEALPVSNYRGREPSSMAFELVDANGQPQYIGHGSLDSLAGTPPWMRLWAKRERLGGALGTWLRSLPAPPELSWAHIPSVLLPKAAAIGVARLRRKALARDGVKLLTVRDHGGGGAPRPVLGYRSLRAAAKAMGLPLSTLGDRLGRRPAG
jgi:hypothetical protein